MKAAVFRWMEEEEEGLFSLPLLFIPPPNSRSEFPLSALPSDQPARLRVGGTIRGGLLSLCVCVCVSV